MTDSVAHVAEGGKAGNGAAKDGAANDGTLSYEQARDKLTAVVKRLESGGLTLEQSIELWERGEQLAAICAEWLDGARARLAAAIARQRTAAETEPEGEAPF
jgi:exodeoxyribonuclease VII small subunit